MNDVLITGASAGLGREFAKVIAAEGRGLVLVARRLDRLEALAQELRDAHKVSVQCIAADLEEADAPLRIFERTQELGLKIDVLINNAGFGSTGPFHALDRERELAMVQVNVTALVHLSRLYLPAMVERKSGGILNVGSTAGFQAGPYMATYYATKAFVQSFSEALAEEVKGHGVHVCCLAPGATATEFAEEAGITKSRLFQAGVASSRSVAESGWRAFKRSHVIAIPGLKNKVIVRLSMVSPRAATRRIAQWLNRSPH